MLIEATLLWLDERSRMLGAIVSLILAATSGVSMAEVVWNGDFSTGNFTQYHVSQDSGEVRFYMIPEYGRPIQYGAQNPLHVGNGDLLSLVAKSERTVSGNYYPQGPTRGGEYAAKFTVKNAASGIEPQDCDIDGTCNDRRSQLKMQTTHPNYYGALMHMEEWWVSISFFLPLDWQPSGSGFGPSMMGIKMADDSYNNTGYFAFEIRNNTWYIRHSWSDSFKPGTLPWQQQMFYQGNLDGKPYPRTGNWPDGLVDFPDIATSHAALKSLYIGGWTDWIVHLKQDHRGSDKGGTGFLEVWKREGSGPWIQVLNILPHETTRGGMTFNHGIGFNLANTSIPGAGTGIGLYMDKNQVWNKPTSRVLYVANHKIGDSSSEFSDMSPDGSSPDIEIVQQEPAPMPPRLLVVE